MGVVNEFQCKYSLTGMNRSKNCRNTTNPYSVRKVLRKNWLAHIKKQQNAITKEWVNYLLENTAGKTQALTNLLRLFCENLEKLRS